MTRLVGLNTTCVLCGHDFDSDVHQTMCVNGPAAAEEYQNE